MTLALEIFNNYGLNFLARWAHVLAGITWIGLLYYFNFVQVPAFAELDAGARNQAVDKLTSARCGGSAGPRRHVPLRPADPGSSRLVGRRRRVSPADYFKRRGRRRDRDRHAARHHDVPQRVGRHLAQPEGRDRQRAQRARRW